MRPWGSFTTYLENVNGLTVKVININPDSRLSLQYHKKRSETWYLLSGQATASSVTWKREMTPEQPLWIPATMIHRLESRDGAMVLEITEGKYDENDIVRVEDDYGRAKKQ